MKIDFGKTSDDYARHRLGFPEIFFSELKTAGFAPSGRRLLDVGSGTGALALRFATEGAQVTALDPSREQLSRARQLAEGQGLQLEYAVASAEDSQLPDATFEFISAGQCWHWFDVSRVCPELRRLLVPRGQVMIASYDWWPTPGSVVAATEALILEHNPAWHLAGGDGLHPEYAEDLSRDGFEILATRDGEHLASYTHEAWRGRIRASAGIAASLSEPAVEDFDRALAELLRTEFPADPLQVPHRYTFCLARSPR